jgi:hypothetical protein
MTIKRKHMGQNEFKRRQVQRLAETAVPLLPVNRPRPGRGHKVKCSPATKHGNRTRYLVNRIARDRPDILARMQAGEFTNVRDVAREAGRIKDASLTEKIQRLWRKATPEERQVIYQRMSEQSKGTA